MELETEQLAGDVTKATPVGRWDARGALLIEVRLSALTATGRPLILDMAQVNYLSSMGLRSIVQSAKTMQQKGGKLALLAPTPNVAEVLMAAGIDAIVPICDDLEKARQAVA